MLGIDLLGGAKYESVAVKAYGKLNGYAAGMFWKQFGDASTLIKDLNAAGCKTFRVHLLWDYSHMYANKETEALTEFNKCMKVFLGRSVKLYISPYCEHKVSVAKMQSLFQKLWTAAKSTELAGCPKPTFVNASTTIVSNFTDAETKAKIAVVNELHIPAATAASATGLPAPPAGNYTVSPDGWDLTSAGAKNYNAKYGGAAIRFAWDATLNLHPKAPTLDHLVALGKLLSVN